MLTSRGLGRVLGDLASMGFDAKWGVLGAADVGANHQRDRIWILATNTRYSQQRQQESFVQQECGKPVWEKSGNLCEDISNTNSIGLQKPAHQQELESQGCNQLQIEQYRNSGEMAYASSIGLQGSNKCGSHEQSRSKGIQSEFARSYGSVSWWWSIEPNVGRVADGMASRVDRLKAIGNGQVPLCAATAFRILSKDI